MIVTLRVIGLWTSFMAKLEASFILKSCGLGGWLGGVGGPHNFRDSPESNLPFPFWICLFGFGAWTLDWDWDSGLSSPNSCFPYWICLFLFGFGSWTLDLDCQFQYKLEYCITRLHILYLLEVLASFHNGYL